MTNNIYFSKKIPFKTGDSLNIFLKQISKYPVLDPDVEKKLLLEAKAGNKFSIDKLIESNLKLVVEVAKQFQEYDLLEDLIQTGVFGLYKAIENFNSEDLRFSTFASKKIYSEILDYLRENKFLINYPVYISKLGSKAKVFINKFEQENEFPPSEEDIREYLNVSDDVIVSVFDYLKTSFEKETDDENESIFDKISYYEKESSLNSEFVQLIQKLLTDREFEIVCKYFGINSPNCSIEDLSEMYSLTKERIRFIINTALTKLQKHPELINKFEG